MSPGWYNENHQLLTNHIFKENNVLNPMARKLLSPAQLERIKSQL
jgi:hemerythrin-like domain-containing protein